MTGGSLLALFFQLIILLCTIVEGPGAVPRCGPGTGVPDCDTHFDVNAGVVFAIGAALLLVGLLIQHRIRVSRCNMPQESLESAAERVSTALRPLQRLGRDELQHECRFMVTNLLTLLDATSREASRHAYVHSPEDRDTWKAIYDVRRELIEMQRRVESVIPSALQVATYERPSVDG